MTNMSSMIHLNANDPLAWMAWNDWIEETGTPRVQPWLVNSIGMKFSLIPPGKFVMGSPANEYGRNGDEGPQHDVDITKAFYLGVYQVTQEQYERVMGTNPSYFSATGGGKDSVKGKDTSKFPVEQVSWDEAVEFCRKLSEMAEEKGSGRKYRLTTEAEWEYTCRGGHSSYQIFNVGNSLSSTQANFNGDYPYGGAGKGSNLGRTCNVGSYTPNGFGLYDMHGNVWEWCSDWYEAEYYAISPRQDPQGPEKGFYRVSRGGGWFDYGWYCRSANRLRNEPVNRFSDYGFRLAVDISESTEVM